MALAGLMPSKGQCETSPLELRVMCRSLKQVEGCANAGAKFVYCDFEDLRQYQEAVAMAREAGVTIFLATPRIQKPTEVGYFKVVEKAEPDGVLVRNLGGVQYFKDRGIRRIADFSLNVANPVTARLLMEEGGFENLTVSYDLNEGQVCDLLEMAPPEWFELTMHQHMPMFHMEHCVFCTFMSEGTSVKDCGKPCEKHEVHLRDRVGQLHVLKADVGCRNTLFNGRAQTGAGSVDELLTRGLGRFRIELLEEGVKRTERLVGLYQRFFEGGVTAQDLVRQLGALERLGVTEGTLERRREEVHR
jgi:putative protease